MAALPGIGNRKRNRNIEEECSEFTPLSKRINNLHLNNPVLPLAKLLHEEIGNDLPYHHKDIVSHERLSELQFDSTRNVNCPTQPPPWPPSYSPDLSPSQNPYYYESNRLLYQIHFEKLERSQRGNGPHPSTSHAPY